MSLFIDNSKEFAINNAKIQIIDNNPYYVLPEETKIYFGFKKPAFDNQPTFFGFDYKTAKKYGFVKTFTTNRKLHLLALMELTPKHSFYKNADPEWKRQMETNFGVGKEIKERFSVGKSDIKMMKYLCSHKNMDGYAMNGQYIADKHQGGYFHAELVLCNPTTDAYLIHAEDHTVPTSPPRGPSKPTRPPSTSSETTPLKSNLFNYSTPDTTPLNSNLFNYSTPDTTPTKPPIGSNLFGPSTPGGKGKNKKTKRKLRKSKKSKRKQRKTHRKSKKSKRKYKKSKKTSSKRGGVLTNSGIDTNKSQDIEATVEQCGICLNDLSQSNIPILPCEHKFHKDCLFEWCKTKNNTAVNCPLCRIDIVDVCKDINPQPDYEGSPPHSPYGRRLSMSDFEPDTPPQGPPLSMSDFDPPTSMRDLYDEEL